MTATATAVDLESVDKVRLAVVQSGLVGVAREMGKIMERASYSAILNEGKDFSCAVFNAGGELVAEGEFVLVHLAAMHEAVKVLIRHFGDDWAEGDIAIHNDPFEGGSHLPDINIVRPVFADGEIIAYVATRAHYPDVGGIVPGSFSGDAATLFHEGIAIPPLKLARADVLDEQLISLWSRNVRVSRRLRADLLAQVASVRVGERRVLELVQRSGAHQVREILAVIPDYGEQLMRSRIAARLAGGNELYDFMDDAGPGSSPVRIHLRAEVTGSSVTFDYTKSDPQAACPINAPLAVLKSATFGAMKCLLAPELPLNSGMYRPFEVLTTPGSVVDPVAPAPVAAGNTNTSQRIFDIVVAAVGELLKDGSGGMAGSYSANSDIGIGGVDPRTGEEFVLYMMPVGGIGARPTLDGESALINYMGNCSSQPVEVWEAMHPLMVREYRLRPDSGGPGRRRGGLGLDLAYEALVDDIELSLFTERQRFAPLGLDGGHPTDPGYYELERDGQRIPLRTKASGLRLRRGDAVILRTAGGGGYGDPLERETARVALDVTRRLVTREQAEATYGVVLDDGGNVDEAATAKRRRELMARRAVWTVTGGDEPDPVALKVGGAVASRLGVVDDQIVCCSFEGREAHARVVVGAAGEDVRVGRLVAGALHLGVGDKLTVRPLRTSWQPVYLEQIRREFSRRTAN